MFCDNKKCKFNDYENPPHRIVRVNINGININIRNHFYESVRSNNENFYLCDCCHNAAQMTVKGIPKS